MPVQIHDVPFNRLEIKTCATTFQAGLKGSVSGAIFGGINGYYGNDWGFGRVAANSFAGGVSAELQGGRFADGFLLAGTLSALTYVNYSMRQSMVENASINPDNINGESEGFFGDGKKLAGARREIDPQTGQYVRGCDSLMGGCQGAPLPNSTDVRSSFFGRLYQPGSWMDRINEAFSGPHDWFRNLTGSYDALGNSRNFVGWRQSFDSVMNYALVLPASPLGGAALVPSSAYGALTTDMATRRRR